MQPEPKVNILLVDDHPENLLALDAILGSLGENLVKANSGQEALRCLLHQDFAVILLDVQMPDMDGFETATLIRSRDRSRRTPIIFLTAFSTSDSMVFKGYSLGAVDYLLKPIEADILLSKVSVFVDLFRKTEEIQRQATQLEESNANLRASEERFRLLSACSPVGIFLTDVDGSCTYTNPRCQAICGFTQEQSLGWGWLEFVHPGDRSQLIKGWSSRSPEMQEYSREVRFVPNGSDVRWTHVRSAPMLSKSGCLLGHVGTIEDITERKQSEEMRAQMVRAQAARQQAESANRMKDEFLAVLSHELRTPLNSMLGWARLLRTRKFDEATTERALETIERNARAQTQLIEDILDVSLIMQGKLRINCFAIDLSPVIESAIDSVRPLAEGKPVHLETQFDPHVGKVRVDPDRLQQVVWNLLTNAIKFTPKGGQVVVRLSQVQDEAPGAIAYAQIQVIDTGSGISADFLPHVFERFRQADGTTTRSHGGLGLGLAIVYHLVDLHDGIVYAESEGEGQGATFTVKIPLALAKAESAGESPSDSNKGPRLTATGPGVQGYRIGQPPTAPQAPVSQPTLPKPVLKNVRVLVVDDEPDTRDFLCFVLRQHDAIATAAESAAEGLELLQQVQPEVLVSDIGMPKTDGYEFIRQVRSLPHDQGGNIPAIALTAYATESDQKLALKQGFQVHLAKPVEPSDLVTAVANLAKVSLS